jgi:hypothetical protein
LGLIVNETKLAQEFVDRLRELLLEWAPKLPGILADGLTPLLVGKRIHAVVKCKGVEVDISLCMETPSDIQVKETP